MALSHSFQCRFFLHARRAPLHVARAHVASAENETLHVHAYAVPPSTSARFGFGAVATLIIPQGGHRGMQYRCLIQCPV
jgi:hypothetical protein